MDTACLKSISIFKPQQWRLCYLNWELYSLKSREDNSQCLILGWRHWGGPVVAWILRPRTTVYRLNLPVRWHCLPSMPLELEQSLTSMLNTVQSFWNTSTRRPHRIESEYMNILCTIICTSAPKKIDDLWKCISTEWMLWSQAFSQCKNLCAAIFMLVLR